MFKISKILTIALLLSSSVQAAGIEALDIASAANLDPKFPKFFDWMRAQGAEFSKIELREERSSMRGMYAVKDIKKGETMLFVPDHLLLSLQRGLGTPLGKIMTEKRLVPGGFRLNAPTMAVLAISNMQEVSLGADSKYADHYLVQPGVEDFPVYFSEEERSYLAGSPFIDYIDTENEDIRYDYSLIAREMPDFGAKYTLDDFKKAKMLVISRNFGVTMNGVETNLQVPLADMFNTETPKNALWYYDDTRHGFIVEAYADVAAGAQLFDSYGKKCNYRFFLNYAFINLNKDGENPENEFPLFIGLDEEDPSFDVKKEVFLDGMESTITEFRVNGHMKEKVMENFLSWIRFVVFDGDLDELYVRVTDAFEEAKRLAESQGKAKWGSIGEYIRPIDLHTEIRAWRKIHQIAQDALAKYPTTLAEDKALLAKEDAAAPADRTLTYNTRNCVLLRVGEKKILNYLLDTASNIVEIGQLNRKGAIGAMMKRHKILKPSMSYVKGTFIPLIPEEIAAAHDEL